MFLLFRSLSVFDGFDCLRFFVGDCKNCVSFTTTSQTSEIQTTNRLGLIAILCCHKFQSALVILEYYERYDVTMQKKKVASLQMLKHSCLDLDSALVQLSKQVTMRITQTT